MKPVSFLLTSVWIAASLLTASAFAATTPVAATALSPRDVISQATDRLTQRINKEHDRIEKEPGYAAKVVSDELDSLVDFKRITRLVMGQWFAHADRDQKYRFLGIFRQSLIDTYASGISLYTGQKINVLPLRDEDLKDGRAFVRMELTTEGGKLVPISYTMIANDGQWQVENVIVNGLNLGKTFRDQFARSADTYKGDLNQVIDHWAEQLKTNDALEEAKGQATAQATK